MAVEPYKGKYAVKTPKFFLEIQELQKVMNPQWLYKPINCEIEITNCCNDHCMHCGMSSVGMNGISYSKTELSHIVDELHQNGVASISITGGEPFVRLDEMLHLMNSARNKIDICKITTNGFWGKDAEEYFDKLIDAGLLDNKLFVPCLMVSIGEQSIPLENVCAILKYAIDNFDSKQLTLCVSSLSEYGKESRVETLLDCYKNNYGELPDGRVFLTENYYRNNNGMKNAAEIIKGNTIEDYMVGPVHCFAQTVGKYILPRLLIKAGGNIITCACFNPPDDLRIGNIKEQSLIQILNEINENVYVKIIAKEGLHGFKNLLDERQYKGVPCANECDACFKLINALKSHEENKSEDGV